MSKVIGGLTGANKIKSGQKKANAALGTRGTSINAGYGSGTMDAEGNVTATGAGDELGNFMIGLGGQLGEAAGGAIPQSLGLNPQDVMNQALAAGNDPTGSGFLGAANNALTALGNFDLTDFIGQRFSQLQELARPGEERAAASLGNKLFSRGRVGGEDTAGGRAFAELDAAQSAAETQRYVDAEQSGIQSWLSQIGGAGQLATTGSGLNQASMQNFLNALGGGIATQTAGQDYFGTLLGGAATATNTANAAFQPSRDAMSTLLAASGMDFDRDAAQAGIYQRAGEARGAAQGNFFGGLLNAFG